MSKQDLSLWPSDAASQWISWDAHELSIPIDWWVQVGGPIRRAFDSYVENWCARDPEGTVLLQLCLSPDPVLAFEIGDLINNSWRQKGIRPSAWTAVSAGLRTEWLKALPELTPIRYLAGLQSHFPKASSDLSWPSLFFGSLFFSFNHTVELQNALAAYRDEGTGQRSMALPNQHESRQQDSPPWIYWSRFPMWLRAQARRSEFSSIELGPLEMRMTEIQVALSPQDERHEVRALEPGSLMMNPTFDVVTRPVAVDSPSPLLGLARLGHAGGDGDFSQLKIAKRHLSELDALIIDEIREQFRASEKRLVANLMANLIQHGRAESEVYQALEELTSAGFILWRRLDH